MTAYLVLAALIIALGLVVYIMAGSLKTARQRVRIAEGKQAVAESMYRAAMTEISAREKDRHDLETQLSALRSGAPRDRLAASLDGLRDAAAHTSSPGTHPDSVAGSPAPARGN